MSVRARINAKHDHTAMMKKEIRFLCALLTHSFILPYSLQTIPLLQAPH